MAIEQLENFERVNKIKFGHCEEDEFFIERELQNFSTVNKD